MKVSVSIMAHPKRTQRACELYAKLLKQPFWVTHITWDQINNEWDTGSRALRFGATCGAEWHVVLQDDAIIPDGFYHQLENALRHVPDRTLVSLYTGTVRPLGKRVAGAVEKARAEQASWIKHYMLLWGVGIVIPTIHIEPMLEFVADRKEAYDVRVGIFYQRNRLPVFYTNPSLVNHDDAMDSLIGNGYDERARVAHNFIRDKKTAWNSHVIDL